MEDNLKKYISDNIELINNIIKNKTCFYKTFYIKKNSGKRRRIDNPKKELKEIQKWILDNILVLLPVSEYAIAYVKHKTIKNNTEFHIGKQCILRLDIKEKRFAT